MCWPFFDGVLNKAPCKHAWQQGALNVQLKLVGVMIGIPLADGEKQQQSRLVAVASTNALSHGEAPASSRVYYLSCTFGDRSCKMSQSDRLSVKNARPWICWEA